MRKARGVFDWRLPAGGTVGAVVLALPTLVLGNDAAAFFASITLALLTAGALFAITLTRVRRQGPAAFAMFGIFLLLSFVLFRTSDYLRTTARWLTHSQSYKKQVLNEPAPLDGSLKHMEWDSWGFPGAGDTTVYLVNDPEDRLVKAAGLHSSGKYSGIPCEAMRVRRLENGWYTVLFYTGTAWDHCIQ